MKKANEYLQSDIPQSNGLRQSHLKFYYSKDVDKALVIAYLEGKIDQIKDDPAYCRDSLVGLNKELNNLLK